MSLWGRLGLLAAGVVLGCLIALLVVYFSASTPLRTAHAFGDRPPAVAEPRFADLVELYGKMDLRGGHRVDVLLNGDGTFPPMWRDIRDASRTVTFFQYFCRPGEIADSLGAALADRARAGVRVLFLYDVVGCQLSDAYFERLDSAGVSVAAFRPVRWWQLHRAQQRSHQRALVIDGRVGYTGGFGIDDRWRGDGTGPLRWRETNVRFTGPAVRELQAAFATGWAEAAGELLTGSDFFPDDATSAGGVVAGLLRTSPDIGSTAAEQFLALSIAAAERTLYIANAYFVPDDDFRRLLASARRRGVDVRVLVPGARTDIALVRLAGRAHYDELLEAGVRIYEYQPSMMHAKTLVVDGRWVSIGTLNFDNRSLALNDEVALNVLDPGIGSFMDALFLHDLRLAHEVRPEEFYERGWWSRAKEKLAVLLSRVL